MSSILSCTALKAHDMEPPEHEILIIKTRRSRNINCNAILILTKGNAEISMIKQVIG